MDEVSVVPQASWRVVVAITSVGVGILLSAFIGLSIVELGGWEIQVSAAHGAEVGRSAAQMAVNAPLDDNRIPTGVVVALSIPLWLCLIAGPVWARTAGLEWRRDLNWGFRGIDVPLGLALGVLTQLVIIPLVYIPIFAIFGEQDVESAARNLVAAVDTPFDVAALILLTAIGAPIAEEILYRGLLHQGLVDMHLDLGKAGLVLATVGSSLLFAASHFQALQLPGLFAFAVVAASVMHWSGRLGTAIWTHVGFNLTAVVALLLRV
jgi:membrane protease YdiL (CAAX protease family)